MKNYSGNRIRASLTLPNSAPPQPAHTFKLCNKCDEMRPPEGGIELRPGKWHCAKCWATRAATPKKKGG